MQQVCSDAQRLREIVEVLCAPAWAHFERGDAAGYPAEKEVALPKLKPDTCGNSTMQWRTHCSGRTRADVRTSGSSSSSGSFGAGASVAKPFGSFAARPCQAVLEVLTANTAARSFWMANGLCDYAMTLELDPARLAEDHSTPAGELTDVEFRRDGSLLVVGGPLRSSE